MLNQTRQDPRPQHQVGAADSIDTELKGLEAARALAREQLHSFSFETLRRWNELEHDIECKLDDMGRLPETGETALVAALARLRELTGAVHDLVERHSHFPARSLMHANVRVCSPRDSLEHAARLLWEADCGSLPVLDDAGRVIGMVTDRDICMAVFTQGQALRECRVESAMSKQVHACLPDDPIQRIAEIMSEQQVRRVPVVGLEGQLLGIVTLADIARRLSGLPGGDPARELLVATVAAITCPRRLVPELS